MKRLLIATAAVTLAFTGLAPTADAHSPTPAVGTAHCVGTAQWHEAGSGSPDEFWEFRPALEWIDGAEIQPGPTCGGASGWYPHPVFHGRTDAMSNVNWTLFRKPTDTSIKLRATGTLECGSGDLEGVDGWPSRASFGTVWYDLSWTAHFEDGVGTVTGTGSADPTYNSHDPTPVDVSGTITLQEGLGGAGDCDSLDSQVPNAVVDLDLVPQE